MNEKSLKEKLQEVLDGVVSADQCKEHAEAIGHLNNESADA